MKLDNFVASSDIYDVYESDGMAVRIYKKPEYKEKCLYAALTHARVETTLGNSFIKMPVLHEVSVIDGKWAITMDFIKGKTLQQLMDENPDKKDTYLNQFIDIQCEIHAQYMPLLSKLKDKMARQIKTLGNASADVARTYLLFCLNNPDLAEAYLDKYCVKSGTSKQYVQAWLPIVAAAQLIKGKPEEKDLLMKWIDVVDYD